MEKVTLKNVSDINVYDDNILNCLCYNIKHQSWVYHRYDYLHNWIDTFQLNLRSWEAKDILLDKNFEISDNLQLNIVKAYIIKHFDKIDLSDNTCPQLFQKVKNDVQED